MDTGVIVGAVFLFIVGVALIIIGISFIADINKDVGPELAVGTAGSDGRTYTFLRVRSTGVAWGVTIVTFVLALAAIVGGIALLATG